MGTFCHSPILGQCQIDGPKSHRDVNCGKINFTSGEHTHSPFWQIYRYLIANLCIVSYDIPQTPNEQFLAADGAPQKWWFSLPQKDQAPPKIGIMVRWLVIADTITTYTTSALQGRDNVLPDQACVRAVTFLVTCLEFFTIWGSGPSQTPNNLTGPSILRSITLLGCIGLPFLVPSCDY